MSDFDDDDHIDVVEVEDVEDADEADAASSLDDEEVTEEVAVAVDDADEFADDDDFGEAISEEEVGEDLVLEFKLDDEDGFGPEKTSHLMKTPPEEESVLDVLVSLLTGLGTTKKTRFRRIGERVIWMSTNLETINWSSRRKETSSSFQLNRIKKVKSLGTDLEIHTLDRQKIVLSMSKEEEVERWVRVLACLTPLQAKVRFNRDKKFEAERETFDLFLETYKGEKLQSFPQINDYYVLDLGNMRNRLVLSRTDRHFLGMTFVSHNNFANLLGSKEEMAVYKKLNHPHVLGFTEFLHREESDGHYAIYEYAPREIVLDPRKIENVRPLQEEMARLLIQNVLSGLSYLHSCRIVHGDIRPQKLLLAVDSTVKINPLGAVAYDYSKKVENGLAGIAMVRSQNCEVAFLAPEQCTADGAPMMPAENYSMDSWSAIALLYFMVCGRVPFVGETPSEIQKKICKDKVEIPDRISKKLKDLFKKVLGERNPKKRPTVDEVLRHPWFLEESGSGLVGRFFGGKKKDTKTKILLTKEEIDEAVSEAQVIYPGEDEYI
mmetsp:Transcript_10729/g.28231  ORF Transcript_10729/g.28231 Transcript_10729/m.28231 type:complete len:549 (+) Transcript_10729:85-1731(+)